MFIPLFKREFLFALSKIVFQICAVQCAIFFTDTCSYFVSAKYNFRGALPNKIILDSESKKYAYLKKN